VIPPRQLIDAEARRLGVGGLAPRPAVEIEDGRRSGRRLASGGHDAHAWGARRGVVDANGRVYGMPNLFVVGGSIFPTGGAAPPALTIVALAARLARHLKSEVFEHRSSTTVDVELRRVSAAAGLRTI
jgi:hypothetical protein